MVAHIQKSKQTKPNQDFALYSAVPKISTKMGLAGKMERAEVTSSRQKHDI